MSRNAFSFRKYRDLFLGITTLLLSGGYLLYTGQIKTRPKMVPAYANSRIIPILLGILLAVMSVLCIIQGIRKVKTYKEDAKEEGDLVAVLLTFATIAVYTALMVPLGYCLSTMLYLFAQMTVLAPKAKRNLKLFALVSVVFTAVTFVVFRIGLQLMLARGIIEQFLGF